MTRALLISLAALLAACSSTADDPANSTTANNSVQNAQTFTVEFKNIRVEELGPNRAVLRFDTSVPTSCEAEYGTAADELTLTATDPDMAEGELTADHEVPLEDLPADTEIFWRARVEDADGAIARSELQSFTTLPAEDTDLPPLQNFAMQGNVTTVSSNFGGADNDSTWGANNAFDGQMGTEWATNGDGDDAMIEVDLGSSRKITHFAFRSREMTDGTSIIEEVQLRFDGGEPIGPFATPDPDERYVFEFENAQQGQIVTLEAVTTTGGNTGAREIEFLGTPKE